jgi:hypothetical protein
VSTEASALKQTRATSRTVAKLVYSILVGCCLLMESGCSEKQISSLNTPAPQRDLAERIRTLGPDGPLIVSFGLLTPGDTEDTIYIIARGKESVPYLVEALNGTNAINVGYAAYCLRKIRSAEGKAAAEKALLKWEPEFGRTSASDFVVDQLSVYLKSTAPPN